MFVFTVLRAMFIIFGLKSIIKQLLDLGFFCFKCIIEQLSDSIFVSVRVITLSSTLIILHITKTSSNNCLLSIY